MDTMKTGAYLATLRKNANMTQQDVADRLGVSNKTISKWESGGGFPDIVILPALAELYGVSADELLAGEALHQEANTPSQVEHYLAQRGALRFRIGYAVAALCLLAAMLFRYSPTAVQGLLIAAAAAALWIGWGGCPKEKLRLRLAMLLPLVAAGIWLLAELVLAVPLSLALTEGHHYGYNVRPLLQRVLPWDILPSFSSPPPTRCSAAACGSGAENRISSPVPTFGCCLQGGRYTLLRRSSASLSHGGHCSPTAHPCSPKCPQNTTRSSPRRLENGMPLKTSRGILWVLPPRRCWWSPSCNLIEKSKSEQKNKTLVGLVFLRYS